MASSALEASSYSPLRAHHVQAHYPLTFLKTLALLPAPLTRPYPPRSNQAPVPNLCNPACPPRSYPISVLAPRNPCFDLASLQAESILLHLAHLLNASCPIDNTPLQNLRMRSKATIRTTCERACLTFSMRTNVPECIQCTNPVDCLSALESALLLPHYMLLVL